MEPAIIKHILLGVVPPLLVGGIAFGLLASRPPAPVAASPQSAVATDRPRAVRALLGLAIVGVVYAVMQPILAGRFAWPPASASDALAWIALAALLSAALSWTLGNIDEIRTWLGRAARWTLRALLIAGLAAFAARRVLDRWTPLEALAWLGSAALLSIIAWYALSRTMSRVPGASGPAVGAVFAVAGAVACVGGLFSLSNAQFSGVIAWTLIGASLVALWRRDLSLGHAGAVVPVLGVGSVVFVSALLAPGETPHALRFIYAALVALVPVGPMLLDRLRPAQREGLGRLIARVGLAILPLIAIGALAAINQPPPSDY